ncbi:DNA methyltransferase [Caldisericum sp.]|uniref:site-specific DNA-methyltransferase n=1 Tax=Caldisericum sp. TaxID=2499687 RepID=UPI003D099C92
MENNKKYTELLWNGKYSESWLKEFFELRKKATISIDKPNLAFQKVETINQPRVKGGAQRSLFPENDWPENYPKDWKNMLIWGDNKLVMSSLLKDFAGKINLIYIDPPFFTGADFTIRTTVGGEEIEKEPSIIEERAYKDTWSGGIASYLKYMYERLVLMRELLAENGSIYVHLDWHVGHYVKVMMDEIFGYENFVNEIVWYYPHMTPAQKHFGRKHDIILWYSKTGSYTINLDEIREPYDEQTIKRYKKPVVFPGGYEAKMHEKGKIPDDVWRIPPIRNVSSEKIYFDTQKPEALLNRIILASSNPGDIVADFFSGSGTTLAVAEKLGRRWIGCDLSKFSIHTTRKRLMDIHNSKDLLNENKESYGKPAKPFEILNIGNYELEYLNDKRFDYLVFMLKLYGAEPITGFRHIHGKKGIRLVHVGSLNAPVSMEEVRNTIKECVDNKITKLDILGWEWSYEVNDLAKQIAKEHKIDLRLIQIPSVNEIKSALVGFDLKLLKMPEEIIDEKILKNIRFSEVSYLEVEPKIQGKKVTIKITDFQVPPSNWLDEIKESIKKYSDLIDYWAVDWDYQGDTFHNQWQAYRTKKERKLELEATKTYDKPGEYQTMIKVVDVFGNDANKIVKVRIK